MSEERRCERTWAALVAVLLIGALLRLALAWQRPAWIDEIYRLAWSHGCNPSSFYDVDSTELCINQHPRRTADVLAAGAPFEPPLNSLALNRWMRTTGAATDFAVRLPLIGLSVLAIAGMYLVGRALAGPRTGVAAAALVALSPFHVYYGEEINNYALASCAIVWAFVFYLRWLQRERPSDAVGYCLCAIAACLTHYYAIMVVCAQALALPVHHGIRMRRLARAAVPFVVVLASFLLYLPVLLKQLPYLTAQKSGTFGGLYGVWHYLITTLLVPWLWVLVDRLPTLVALLLAAFVAMLFVSGLRTIRQPRLGAVLAVNAIAPPAAVAIAYLLRRSNQILWPRYGLFFTFAAFAPMAAVWSAARWDVRRWAAAAIAGGLLACGLGVLFFGVRQRDWRSAAQTIVGHGSPGEGVIVHNPNLVFELGRYLPAQWRMYGVGDDGATLPLQVAGAADARGGMWAAFAWDEDTTVPARVRRALDCRYAFREDYPLPGIALSRYHDGPGPIPGARATECGPTNGFLVDGGDCAIDPDTRTLSVRGWVDVVDPSSTLRVLVDGHGDAAGAHPVVEPPWATTPAPVPGTTRVWFAEVIDTTAIPEGTLLPITLEVRSRDGALQTARETLYCVKRAAIAMRGTPGARGIAAWIGAPTRGKRFRQGTPISVNGWAFATPGIANIALYLDGREILRSRQHGFAGPYVSPFFPEVDVELTTRSGFIARLDTADISPGRHVLKAACVLPDGSTVVASPGRRFEILPAPPP